MSAAAMNAVLLRTLLDLLRFSGDWLLSVDCPSDDLYGFCCGIRLDQRGSLLRWELRGPSLPVLRSPLLSLAPLRLDLAIGPGAVVH